MSSLFSGRLGSYVVLLHGSKEFIGLINFTTFQENFTQITIKPIVFIKNGKTHCKTMKHLDMDNP